MQLPFHLTIVGCNGNCIDQPKHPNLYEIGVFCLGNWYFNYKPAFLWGAWSEWSTSHALDKSVGLFGCHLERKMTPLEDFKEILKEKNISVPETTLEFFRDLVDTQADFILDSFLRGNQVADKV